jgi:hypothetical protein
MASASNYLSMHMSIHAMYPDKMFFFSIFVLNAINMCKPSSINCVINFCSLGLFFRVFVNICLPAVGGQVRDMPCFPT